MKSFLISAFSLVLLLSTYSFAFSLSQFEGSDWRSSSCSSYADSLLQGTYNYKFSEKGKIDTYIEYYTDLSCQTKVGWIDYQTTGTYVIKDTFKNGDSYLYNVEVKLSHLNYPLFLKLTVKNDNMILCWKDRVHCGTYNRIK